MAAHPELAPTREWAADTDNPGTVLDPGQNCWTIGRAGRAALLIDAAEYFAQLDRSLRAAVRSIQIVGWDFDGRIRLRPNDDDSAPLGQLLRELVEQRPELEIRILVWSIAVIHAPSAPLPLLLGADWQDHPRIKVKLDRAHPFYASHHQKIVTIDDTLAFCGGIDLTVQRWDTTQHEERNCYRCDPDGAAYAPVHDVQMIVDGAPARALADVARERWWRATGEHVRPDVESRVQAPWPVSCTPDFRNVDVAVSRTVPVWRGLEGAEEIAALTRDLLLAARETVYIEAQYFCGRDFRRTMSEVLSGSTGPEILAVTSRNAHGVVEQAVMGQNRDRVIRRLQRIDLHNRLKVYSPVVDGPNGPCDVMVHAKLMIVDDRYLRVGSANLNNRSLGLDTECDLVIEARDEPARRTIAGIRSRLLGEHLGVEPAGVRHSIRERGLIAGVDRLNTHPRGLRAFASELKGVPEYSVFGTALFDPRRPFEPAWFRRLSRNR